MTLRDIDTATREELAEECRRLFHRVGWLEKQVFGPKSERSVSDAAQTSLELGIEDTQSTAALKVLSIAGHERRISNKPSSDIPDGLPVLSEETILPDVDVSRCDVIGEELSHRLERIPAKIGWHLIHRPKLRDRENGEIFIADLPLHCNPKGIAGSSVIASVYANKFQFHQPLYRQSQSIRQECGVSFAESTLVDMVSTADFWLSAISQRIAQLVMEQSYLQADESRIPVLTKGKHGKLHSGYEWVVYAPALKAVVFRYEPGRAQKYADEIFARFKGRLQTDDYDGYNSVRQNKEVVPIGCMAHARRYFVKAIDHPKLAEVVMTIFKELYAVEDMAREKQMTHAQRLLRRQEKSKPLMQQLKSFLQQNRTGLTPASKIAKAFDYTLNNFKELSVFLDDGEVEIDNNLIENAIRPLALGRKNWMFAGSANGAKWASTAYTIIATAKLHGLDPYAYIASLLEKLPQTKPDDYDRLLPWSVKL
jgi:transposase